MAQDIAELTEGQFATIDWVLKRYRDAQDRTEGHIEAVANIAPDLDAWLRSLLQIVKSHKVTWIPCEEKRMPTAGKKVWAWCTAEGGFPFWGHWNWQEPIWVDPGGNGPYPVSHWMEIRWPPPPAAE